MQSARKRPVKIESILNGTAMVNIVLTYILSPAPRRIHPWGSSAVLASGIASVSGVDVTRDDDNNACRVQRGLGGKGFSP